MPRAVPKSLLLALPLMLLAPTTACLKGKVSSPDRMMAKTTIGQNRCSEVDPTDRPFVVEWDATDMASFEAFAQRDVVVVRYQNCELEVLDGCMDDGIKAKYGAYDAPRWTTGSIEGFEISNEYDLYLKLPLGAAKLSGEVTGGASLSLQYFVAGTVNSTRGSLYGGELASNPQCEGATHFVRGYNLGAFELLATQSNAQGVEGSVRGGAGAGGGREHRDSRLRQGGDLSACTANSAKDLGRCRLPIRLTLRELTAGDNPNPPKASTGLPPTGPSADGTQTAFEEAVSLHSSAASKMQTGDGKGCLIDLDRAAELDPKSAPKVSMLRGTCEMQVGQCEDGKKRIRTFLERNSPGLTAEQLDASVNATATQHCPKQ